MALVKLVKHDLEFILKQIKIAETHVGSGANLADLVAQAGATDGTNGTAPSQAALLPYGLRTVDGSYNNLIPGREMWGAADQPFKELLDPTHLNDQDGDSLAFSPTIVYGNNDYGVQGNGTHVIDADPRIISNLIVDQTTANPAALAAMSGDAFTFDHDNDSATPDLVFLPNVAPDDGISAPFNSWMTLFGQFFDHGLDLVSKGGNGTVYIPLQPDDPLYKEGSHTNFMALTRVSEDPVNRTTAWIDQNQTYGSTASKQVFMREYAMGPDGKPIATGNLLEGEKGGLATWADIKHQAKEMLGIELTDADVGNIPLVASDAYGNFIPGPNGYAQLVVGLGPDGKLGTADDVLREGTPEAPASTVGVARTSHAFLDDIAHNAVPVLSNGSLRPDTDSAAGNSIPVDARGNNTAYDNELLDAHYVTGDGRGNENIGLTAVHHVFHSEHNRLIEETKKLALESGDLKFLNEWLLVDVEAIPTTDAGKAALTWDGERLFQAGRFVNEMEYQHLVFEEFGRKMQPDIDAFVFEPSVDIDPSITAEFAHVVYRFGHSMLNENVDRIEMVNGKPVSNDIGLIQAFLNPIEFANAGSADEAAGAIIRGMTRQVGNEIDEFVTPALRSNLLGLPLDLATINLARGRDVGMPTLNKARETFFEATGDSKLKPYDSWVDFTGNIKNPASVINFIAAYGTHDSITAESTLLGKRAAATALVLGKPQQIGQDDLSTPDVDESRWANVPQDRVAFLNSTGSWAGKETGLGLIDFWIGGLAEQKMSFGGMLGSTFTFVFQMQMENLQDADRFYYLSRTQGLNLLNELENNSFAELAMRNTDLGDPGSTSLPGDLFSAMNIILEMDKSKQIGEDPKRSPANPTLDAISPLVVRRDTDGDGDPDYVAYNGSDHIVIGGTEEGDTIIAGAGDDAVWGRGGDDTIEAGYGVDKIHGGDGNDVITNAGTDIGEMDFLHGEAGDDVIHGGNGLALIFGNEGDDFIVTGPDGKEAFGGTGTDFILGGSGGDFLLGNEGDDWLEGGERFDTLAGENSELFFNSTIIGHDVLNAGSGDGDYDAESGDDIMFQSAGIQRNNGMAGFDWAIHKGDSSAANSDLGIPIFVNQEQFILRDRFDLVEGLSGWKYSDTLTGRETALGARDEATGGAAIPGLDAPLESYSNALLEKNLDLILGLRDLFSHKTWDGSDPYAVVLNTGDSSDILLGGGGSDIIRGKAGDDVIDGDKWLNVRISVRDKLDHTKELFSVDSLSEIQARMFSREITVDQLEIVREILDGNAAGDVDTAVYSGALADYTFSRNADGSVRVVGDDTGTAGDTLRNIERIRFVDADTGATTAEFDLLSLLNDAELPTPTLAVSGPVSLSEGDSGTTTFTFTVTRAGDTSGASSASWSVTGAVGSAVDAADFVGGLPSGTVSFAAGETTKTITIEVAGDLAVEADETFAVTLSDPSAGTTIIAEAIGTIQNDDALPAPALALSGPVSLSEGNSGVTAFTFTVTRSGDSSGASSADWAVTGGDGSPADASDFVGGLPSGTVSFAAGETTKTITIEVVGNAVMEADEVFILTLSAPSEGTTITAGSATGIIQNDDVPGGTPTQGDDNLIGTDLAERIDALGGNDVVDGRGGNDTLLGGAGNDNLTGGAGVDRLEGGLGDDTYNADEAGDQIIEKSGAGTDTVFFSGAGKFTLKSNVENLELTGSANSSGTGNSLDNRIIGNSGNNILSAGDGNDEIRGGDGDDKITAGDGDDLIFGGAGNDTAVFSDKRDKVTISKAADGSIIVKGSDGTDTVSEVEFFNFAGKTFLAADLVGPTGSSLAVSGALSLSEGSSGTTAFAFTVTRSGDTSGSSTASWSVAGSGGSPISFDDFVGGLPSGTVVFAAGEVSKTITVNVAGDKAVEADEGFTLTLSSPSAGTTIKTATSTGTIRNDDAVAGGTTPTAGDDILTGTDGADRIDALAGDDVLDGRAGADTLYGGAGNDTLMGGAGVDRLEGGVGDDTYYVDSTSDLVVEKGSAGTDTVISSAAGKFTLKTNIENLVLTGTADNSGTGNSGDNTITGNAGSNTLSGDDGNDSIFGWGGDDLIEGGAGWDTLSGGAGDDRFIFRAVGDVGGGSSGLSSDIVMDWAVGDKIDLSRIDAISSTSTNDKFTFVESGTFTGGGQLRYGQDAVAGETYVEGDINGDGAADFSLALRGLHALSSTDIIL
jgi:Ca2+-binding RTX toxin-like protein